MSHLEVVDTAGTGAYQPGLYIHVPLTPACSDNLCVYARSEQFTSMLDFWIRGSDGFILMYSITSRRSFKELLVLHHNIVRIKQEDRPTCMIVGNNSENAREREVSLAEAQALSTYDSPGSGTGLTLCS